MTMRGRVVPGACALLLVSMLFAGRGRAGEDLAAAQDRAAARLRQCKPSTPPPELYAAFSDFCHAFFGARQEPLVYKLFGEKLELLAGGAWAHASPHSAVVGFETNLPAHSRVSCWKDGGERKVSKSGSRFWYIHQHRLEDLEPGTRYHYRVEVMDERGNLVKGRERSLSTPAAADGVPVPGKLPGPPYVLDRPKATYVLSRDLVTPGLAIEVVGDDITLDLDGHSITFGQGAAAKVAAGILLRGSEKTRKRYLASGCKVVNGLIRQGKSPALAANKSSADFTPLVLKGGDAELGGLVIAYHGPQTWGLRCEHPGGKVVIHHNVFRDLGAKITNRHGSAVRSLGFAKTGRCYNQYAVHHNRIERTRQNGINGASHVYANEIYLDSYSTNSFAVQPVSFPGVRSGEYHHNRIFGTGFNVYGFGWAHKQLKVHDNLVHFQGLMLTKRWGERWGDMSMLEGMRVTNYGKGGQVREDLEYWHNLIVLKGRGGCELRGTGFFSDVHIKDLVFHDNTVKVISEDAKTRQVACVSAHGHVNMPDSQPVVYRDNTFITNLCHLRFGDSYGKGHNHWFIHNRLVRTGARKDYHTVVFGGAYWTWGHRLLDNAYVGKDVSPTNVLWQRTGHKSWYRVEWTLALKAVVGAGVRITDKTGGQVFAGKIPAGGVLRVPLVEKVIHPPTWPKGGEAKGRRDFAVEAKTPHTIELDAGGNRVTRKVTMDAPKTVSMP